MLPQSNRRITKKNVVYLEYCGKNSVTFFKVTLLKQFKDIKC